MLIGLLSQEHFGSGAEYHSPSPRSTLCSILSVGMGKEARTYPGKMELSVLTNDRTVSKTWGSARDVSQPEGRERSNWGEWAELTWSQALLLSGSTRPCRAGGRGRSLIDLGGLLDGPNKFWKDDWMMVCVFSNQKRPANNSPCYGITDVKASKCLSRSLPGFLLSCFDSSSSFPLALYGKNHIPFPTGLMQFHWYGKLFQRQSEP